MGQLSPCAATTELAHSGALESQLEKPTPSKKDPKQPKITKKKKKKKNRTYFLGIFCGVNAEVFRGHSKW